MLSRRDFQTGAVAAAGLALTSPAVAQPSGAPMRRSAGAMALDDPDIVAYRLAVARMKALPETDSRSWVRQMTIHFSFCPHSNWYFLPWHRAYITAFERICREMSGKADFALPFWDWSQDRTLPAAFAAGTPETNALNHPRPGFGPTDRLPDEFFGPSVIDAILDIGDFETFGSTRPTDQNDTSATWLRADGANGELEATPHNTLHGILGGDMGGYRSPRDPIFWLHHCNVDRLWTLWNRNGGVNSDEALWLDMRLDGMFVVGDGSPWRLGVRDVLVTDTLGFRYPGAAAPIVGASSSGRRVSLLRRLSSAIRSRIRGRAENVDLPGGGKALLAAAANTEGATRLRPLSVKVALGRKLHEILKPLKLSHSGLRSGRLRALRGGPPQRVLATIRNIALPGDRETRFRVFVNCDYLTIATPITDPHYAGSYAFFKPLDLGHTHGSGSPTASFTLDITATLDRIRAAGGRDGEQIVVQLVALGKGDEAATKLVPEKVEIAIL